MNTRKTIHKVLMWAIAGLLFSAYPIIPGIGAATRQVNSGSRPVLAEPSGGFGGLVVSLQPQSDVSSVGESVQANLHILPLKNVSSLSILLEMAGGAPIVVDNASSTLPAASVGEEVEMTIQYTVNGPGRKELWAFVEAVDEAGNPVVGASNVVYVLASEGEVLHGPAGYDSLRLKSLAQAHAAGELSDAEYATEVGEVGGQAELEALSAAPSTVPLLVTVHGRVVWTDSAGMTHPVRLAPVRIYKDIPGGPALITTARTNLYGYYSETLGSGEGDYFVQVLAQGDGFAVYKPVEVGQECVHSFTGDPCDPGSGDPYCQCWPIYGPGSIRSIQSEVYTVDFAAGIYGAKIDVAARNILPDGSTPLDEVAFSIHDALVTAVQYAVRMRGSSMPEVDIMFPNPDPSSYYVPEDTTLFVGAQDWYDWDVIQHEYGHHVEETLGIHDSPGGPHAADMNLSELSFWNPEATKDTGTRLAWSEGWASYFAVSLQHVEDIPDVSTVGDARFQDRRGVLGEGDYIDYDLEAQTGYLSLGEDNEIAVQRILWDLFDSHSTYTPP